MCRTHFLAVVAEVSIVLFLVTGSPRSSWRTSTALCYATLSHSVLTWTCSVLTVILWSRCSTNEEVEASWSVVVGTRTAIWQVTEPKSKSVCSGFKADVQNYYKMLRPLGHVLLKISCVLFCLFYFIVYLLHTHREVLGKRSRILVICALGR